MVMKGTLREAETYCRKGRQSNPAIHKPLLRRMKIIHLEKRWDEEPRELEKDRREEERKPEKKLARKFDQPLKKPAMYRQNAQGEIVPNKIRQELITASAVKMPRLVTPEPIVIDDSEESMISIEDTIEGICDCCGKDESVNYMKSLGNDIFCSRIPAFQF